MQLARELKEEGNACFNSGDIDKAAMIYKQAIDFLTQERVKEEEEGIPMPTTMDEGSRLFAVLYSNLSNVFHVQGRYDDSWMAAQQATFYDPTFTKAWFRYVHNRRLAGYPFEAFVSLLRHFRPLLRCSASSSSPVVSVSDITAMELSLFEDLGLSRVLSHIELEEYEGGVGIIARKAIKPGEIILVEKRFNTLLLEMDPGAQRNLTTMKMVSYFANKIFPHQRDLSERWVYLQKQFKGCWPRRSEDISGKTRDKLFQALRAQFPEMNDSDFEDLFAFALMCRYNCFHNGFFRACALANHSCHANAAMKFNSGDGTMTLIAVRHIASEEFVNVKYISDAQFIMGVGNRRGYLCSWLFWCACDRCCMDNNSSATQEQVECRQCNRYTHLPLAYDKTELAEEDPLLPREKPCTHCGAIVTWSPESRTIVAQLIASFSRVTVNQTYDKVITWLQEGLLQVIRLRVHPDHWLYRGLFYFFCISVKSVIDEAYDQFSARGWSSPLVEILLRDVGVQRLYSGVICGAMDRGHLQLESGRISEHFNGSADDCGNNDAGCIGGGVGGEVAKTVGEAVGGDVLYVFCVLWRLISPFYPENEGWAVHRAICHLVLFSHTNPNESAALSDTEALKLLRHHGKWIGGADASLWLHVYNRFRPTTRRNGLLSIKQIKNAFQF